MEYKPSQEERDLIKKVNGMMDSAKRARRKTSQLWRESEKLYMGEHWEGLSMPEYKNQLTLEKIIAFNEQNKQQEMKYFQQEVFIKSQAKGPLTEPEYIDALAKRLKAAGFNADKVGAENLYRRNLYYIDPNGFEVEFVEYLTDLPNERNHYND